MKIYKDENFDNSVKRIECEIMTESKRCPENDCQFWAIPLRSLTDLYEVPKKGERCCLYLEVEAKCVRNPRFSDDLEAEDHFQEVDEEELERLILEHEEPETLKD